MNISNIPSEKFFYACDGSVIKHLGELPAALRNMSPEAFAFHVNDEKNDFHSWVSNVFDHSRLARSIKISKSKLSTFTVKLRSVISKERPACFKRLKESVAKRPFFWRASVSLIVIVKKLNIKNLRSFLQRVIKNTLQKTFTF